MEILVGSVVRRLRHCQALTWKAMESCVALESPQMERAVIFFALLSAAPVAAQISGQDVRNTSIPDLDTHFQMPAFASRAEWLEKAAFLRKQILSSAGLLPMPEKTPLRAQIFGRIEHPDYTVEKVLLATYPGFYLGGNLYRPRGKPGPFPVIVSSHGHWA